MTEQQQPTRKSPLTLTEVPISYQPRRTGPNIYSDDYFAIRFQHEGGSIFVEDRNMKLMAGSRHMQPVGNAVGYSDRQLASAWSLIRSKVRNGWRHGAMPIMVLAELTYKEFVEGHPELWFEYNVLSFERELAEAQALAFNEKALKTLENLYEDWIERRGPINLAFTKANPIFPNMPFFEFDPKADTQWLAYGCDAQEAYSAYRFLYDTGCIRFVEGGGVDMENTSRPNGVEITPTGIQKVEDIRSGRDPLLRDVFFIRKHGEELDLAIDPLIEKIEAEISCKISPVWKRVHNKKIDEYVLGLISQCGVMLLWVDIGNFNVGLEAGYALALNKPIVAFRERPLEKTPEREKQLPFDIRTLNVYEWEKGKDDDFVRVISARILAGFEEIKLRQ